ncbi:MAG: hypothetical protein ABEJ30_07115 [Halorientalis sp.]
MSPEPVPRAEFDRALRRLDAPALAALVADLRSARGETARREGDRVVGDDGTTVHAHDGAGLLGRTRRPPDPEAVDADLVVTNVAAPGDGVVDARDLREALLYAVPPATGDALCRRHLGVPARREPASPARSRLRPAAVVALVAVLAVAGVALATALPDGVGGEVTAPAVDEAAGAPTADPVAGGADRPSPRDGEVAPGVGRNGSVDADRLADAHARVLEDTSYTWAVTYREYRNGTLVAAVDWRVAVAAPGRYASAVTGGPANGSAASVVGETAYADGEVRYEPAPDGGVTRERVDATTAPGVEAATRLISWYLSVGSASVGQVGRADDGRHYVFAEGDPWPGTEAERTVAVVRDYGLVDSLHRSHRIAGTNTTAVVDFEYRETGATAVREPAWVRNATGPPTAPPT